MENNLPPTSNLQSKDCRYKNKIKLVDEWNQGKASAPWYRQQLDGAHMSWPIAHGTMAKWKWSWIRGD